MNAVLQIIQEATARRTIVWVVFRRGRSRNMAVCAALMAGAIMLALGRRRKTPRESRLTFASRCARNACALKRYTLDKSSCPVRT